MLIDMGFNILLNILYYYWFHNNWLGTAEVKHQSETWIHKAHYNAWTSQLDQEISHVEQGQNFNFLVTNR